MPILTNPYMIQAMRAMQQMPSGQQAYGRQMRGLGGQFGLAQRRATMQAGQLNIPPHLQFAIGQQQLPGMYGQYAGALGAAAGQAGQLDVRRAATMGQFGIGASRVALEEERFNLMREEMERQRRPNFWNILGSVAGIGTGIAGLAMGNPMSVANMARMGSQFGNYQRGMTPPPQLPMFDFQYQQPMAPGTGGGMGMPMGRAMNWMRPPGYGGY